MGWFSNISKGLQLVGLVGEFVDALGGKETITIQELLSLFMEGGKIFGMKTVYQVPKEFKQAFIEIRK
jgi:hypothetical protein